MPLLALTATATPRVQADVVQQLGLKHCVVFRSSFNRTNLRWDAPQKFSYFEGQLQRIAKTLLESVVAKAS